MSRYTLTTYDGKRVDALTAAALREAAHRLGYPLTVTQGSYNAGAVAASGGTHDGGGVVDLAPYDHDRKVATLRAVGFAAWYRTPSQGPWPAHIHAVLIGHGKLSPAARAQVDAYLAGRNGLANNGSDDGPRRYVHARYRWRRGAGRVARSRQLLAQARKLLRPDAPGRPGVRGQGVAGVRVQLGQLIGRWPRRGKP